MPRGKGGKQQKAKGQQQQQQSSTPSAAPPPSQSSPPPQKSPPTRGGNSPVQVLAAIIDEHNTRHEGDEERQLQLFVGPGTAAAAAAATAGDAGPETAPKQRQKNLLRSLSAPDELTKLLVSNDSDDSLFSRSLTQLTGARTPTNNSSPFTKDSSSSSTAAAASAPSKNANTADGPALVLKMVPNRSFDFGTAAGGVAKVKNASDGGADNNNVFTSENTRNNQQQQQQQKQPSSASSPSSPDLEERDLKRRTMRTFSPSRTAVEHEEDPLEFFDPISSLPVKASFLPLLGLPSIANRGSPNDVDPPAGTDAASKMNTMLRLVGGLVLVRRIQWHNLLLAVASYVYIPLIAALCVATANALLAVTSHAILPVIEYHDAGIVDGATDTAATPTAATAAASISVNPIDDASAATGAAASAAVYSFFAHRLGGDSESDAAAAAVSQQEVATFGALMGVLMASSVSLLIVAGVGVAGYKASSLTADAFLDSARIVVDRRSGLTLYLFSLYSDIVRIFHLGWRWVAVFTMILVGIPGSLLLAIVTGGWPGGRAVATRPAFFAAMAALLFEVLWLIFQIVRFLLRLTKPQTKSAAAAASFTDQSPPGSPASPTKTATAGAGAKFTPQNLSTPLTLGPSSPVVPTTGNKKVDLLADQLLVWWSRKIVKMRKRNFFLLFLTACCVTLGSGILNGIISLAEGLLYASALHLSAHIAARATLFFRAVRVALRTLGSNPAALVSALIVMPIFLLIAIVNMYRFGFGIASIQLPVLVLALCSIASHAQDRKEQQERDRVSRQKQEQQQRRFPTSSSTSAASSAPPPAPAGPGTEEENISRLFSDVHFVLWRVFLFNPRNSFNYGIHWRYARYVRVMLRVIIFVFAVACVAVTTWTAAQSIQFRFQAFQSDLVTVQELEDGSGGLKTYTDSFSLELRPVSNKKNNSSSANKTTSTNSSSRHYRGMCQRRWWLANGEDSLELFTDPENPLEHPTEEDENEELTFADIGFFSMLAYVAPIDKQQSQKKLFDFYRRHRVGASEWRAENPMEFVWEPLRAEVSSSRTGGGQQQQQQTKEFLTREEKAEARELIRWSRLHMAQSLRPPFLHYTRTRTKKNKMGSKKPSTTIEDSLYVMRGTELVLAADLFQNMIIFADLFLVEQLAYLVPGVGLLPLEFARDLISATNSIATTPETLFHHAHLRRYMRAHQLLGLARKRRQGDTGVAFRMNQLPCGHSLGGVTASIAGPSLRLPAVAISAPGTFFLSSKFGVDPEVTESLTTNLVPSRDIIPLIGSLNGEVFNIACEHDSSMLCHSIQLSLHRMLRHCDGHRQLFRVETNYEVRTSPVTRLLQSVNSWLESFLGVELQFS